MSIQSNVNQGISLAGFLIQTNPAIQEKAKTKRELASLGRQEAAVTQAREVAQLPKEKLLYQDELTDIKRRQFELEPSTESYKGYRGAYEATEKGALEKARAIAPEPTAEDIEQNKQEYIEAESLRRFEEAKREEEINKAVEALRESEQKAIDSTIAKQEQKRKSRRSFASYHEKMLASQGFDPSKIPQATKEEMMNQYSKKERRDIMNKIDKEGSNG